MTKLSQSFGNVYIYNVMFLARFAKATETVGFPKPINKELLCLVMSNSSGVCMGWRFFLGSGQLMCYV